jgi:transposase
MDSDGDFQGRAVAEAIPAEPPRLRQPDRAQVLLEPVCLDKRLPAEHPARLIWEVVRHLDLSAFYAPIAARGSEPGRPATDPQLLVALWLYATVDGVGNGRKLDRLCRAHDAYKWLCGGVALNYHTLNDFRVAHERALDELMTRVVAALTAQGVVRVDRITQDGRRVRASAGSSSFHREPTLRRHLAQTRAYIEELKQQADDEPAEAARQRAARERAAREKQARLEQALALLPELQAAQENPRNSKKQREKPVRVSSTDPEARKMKMGDGGTRPAYNPPRRTTGGGHGKSGARGGGRGQYAGGPEPVRRGGEPLRQQVEQRTGQKVKEHLVDQGYVDLESIARAHQAGVAVYAPLPTGKDGQPVTASRWDTPGTTAWRQRMQTEAAREIYKQRAAVSETINAETKCRFGVRAFAVRGLRKVRCVALWMALAYNLMHFAQVLLRGEVI